MSAHSRPVDKKKPPAKKRKVKRVNGFGPKTSRTAINPAEPWPFPSGGKS